MSTKIFASAIIAGTAAVGLALAPVAGATGNDMDCADKGTATVCQKTGHASMNARPGTTSGGSSYWPFGAGPATPPIWAMS